MKKHISAILALLIFLVPFTLAAPAPTRLASVSGQADIASREETIYAGLSHNGSLKELTAVVRLGVQAAGSYTDYGRFSEVVNLTNALEPTLGADGVRWDFPQPYPGFVYQGALSGLSLPFELEIGYTLNGASAQPERLGGVSGEVGINVSIKRSSTAAPVFTGDYMLQLQLAFPADGCSITGSGGGVSVLSGSSRVLTLVCLPGKNLESSITLKCTSFELTSASLAMTPYDLGAIIGENMPELDLSALQDGLAQLSGGLEQLREGTEYLHSGQLAADSAISELSAAAVTLSQSAAQLSNGLSQLSTAVKKYEALFTQYVTGGDQFIKTFHSLNEGAKELAEGANRLKDGLSALSGEHVAFPAATQTLLDGEDKLLAGFSSFRGSLEAIPEQLGASGEKSELVSFVNGSSEVASVQFVCVLPEIKIMPQEKAPPVTEAKKGFWQRLAGLFGG